MMRLPKWLVVTLAFALLVGLGAPVLAADVSGDEQTAKGTIKSVSAKNNWFVMTVKGRDLTFQLGEDAKVRVGDKDAKLADLRAGDEVQVTYREQAKAVRTAAGKHAQGRIESISADKKEFVVKDAKGKEHTFNLGRDAKVRLDGKESQFADLKTGDQVVIAYEKEADQMMARHIRSTRRGATRTALGEIKSISAAKNQLTLKDLGGKEHTFNLARDAKVQLGEKEGKLADLKAGDEVNVTYQALATNVRSNRP
jgi:ribosomal 50S subunit-recycling heat shock protein